MTRVLQRRLATEGIDLVSSAEFEVVRVIKEQLCYVAKDLTAENSKGLEQVTGTCTLPGGESIDIGRARYEAPEALFQPATYLAPGQDMSGLHELVKEALAKADPDLRPVLASNIILSGGGSCIERLPERLTLELTRLLPSAKVNLYAPPERKHGAWIGASKMADTASWTTAETYATNGPAVFN
ncbi:hypothetical protein OG897_03940 [Streptomyces sp. NBC_00237]|uniref:hypothetical protein n=1 Tax=Streptomyces sp. NBC_00237 TaxID=2975687 RepID=UPI0022581CED|nr:hypothetical protein [Streptomyces sp. NBC_00237]MCX5200617.1 hypothetical protein [Streptomyces sp. NBC_00237]